MKALCIVCTWFKTGSWVLGFCTKKNHYIHKANRNCTHYNQGWSVDNDPKWLLQWFKNAVHISNERYRLALEFMETKKNE